MHGVTMKFPDSRFCNRLSRHQSHSTARRLKSMKNSTDSTRNGTRDLPACGAVPQSSAPLLTRHITKVMYNTLILLHCHCMWFSDLNLKQYHKKKHMTSRDHNVCTVGYRFTTGVRSRIFGCKSNRRKMGGLY